MSGTEIEPAPRWHIEPYDPDIDDPPSPGEDDCIGEYDGDAPPPIDVPVPEAGEAGEVDDEGGDGGGSSGETGGGSGCGVTPEGGDDDG